jgi:transcriptional regulator with XRE-family HTH domain
MKTGIDKGVLSKYETGEYIPTPPNLIILADFYKTSLDYLMDRTDVREPYPPMPENSPDDTKYINHIKLLRVTRDWTQLQLQMRINIDNGVLSKYETGHAIPTTPNLILFANFYKTSLDYLMDRTDVREPHPPMSKKSPDDY